MIFVKDTATADHLTPASQRLQVSDELPVRSGLTLYRWW